MMKKLVGRNNSKWSFLKVTRLTFAIVIDKKSTSFGVFPITIDFLTIIYYISESYNFWR